MWDERQKPLSPFSLSVFSLVPDLLFDCSRVLENAKIRTFLQSIRKMKPNKLIWMTKQNYCWSKWISFINFWLKQFFAKRTKKATVFRDCKSNQGPKVTLKRRNVLRHWSLVVQSCVRNPLQPIMLIFWNAIGSKVHDTSLACSKSIMLRRCRQWLEGQIHRDTSCIRIRWRSEIHTWQIKSAPGSYLVEDHSLHQNF